MIARVLGAGVVHLVVVGLALVGLGHGVVGPVAAAGLLATGALPAYLLLAHRLWLPAVLLGVALAVVAVLEVVTPGPWVTVLGVGGSGGDRLTVGTPVLRSYAESSPLLLAVLGLAGLGQSALRRRRSRRHALGSALLTTLGVLAAIGCAGLARGWATALPAGLTWGAPALAVLVLGAVFLLLRSRLVTPWLVVVVALTVAVVAFWVQDPWITDAASGPIGGAWSWLSVALLLGLGEALVRGVAAMVQRVRRVAPGVPDTEISSRGGGGIGR